MINGKHGQGTHSNKMGADKLFEKKEPINKNIVKLQAYFLNIYKDQSTVSVTFWQRGENPGKVWYGLKTCCSHD